MSQQKRIRYTDEFKREAVKLLEQSGQTPASVGRNLGVDRTSIPRWREEFGAGRQPEQGEESAATGPDLGELKRLRAEVKQLRMERELLKKATAFFAKESN